MPTTEAQKRANQKWREANKDKYNTLSDTGEISNEIFYSEKTKKFLESTEM